MMALSIVLCAASLLYAPVDEFAAGRHVRLGQVDGVDCLTIQAQTVPLQALVLELAGALSLRLEELPDKVGASLVTVDLARRPVKQALEYVLGSVGLSCDVRAGALRVQPFAAARDDLLLLALASYARAIARFPGHALAEQARLSQGEIEERRGHPASALLHYQALILNQSTGETLGEVHLRAGRVCQELGRWQEAGEHFRALSAVDPAEERQRIARLEMARCLVSAGEHEKALNVLASLDSGYPSAPRAESNERELVRARALAGCGRAAESLAVLSTLDLEELQPSRRRELLPALAQALESSGRAGEAGRAWLAIAAGSSAAERLHALESAARLALADGDELGVLLVRALAAGQDASAALLDCERSARERLGLSAGAGTEGLTPTQRIALAERWTAQGRAHEALTVLDALALGGAARGVEDELDLVLARAGALAASAGLEPALDLLREARGRAQLDLNRARCDLRAAELLERSQRWAEAADAYEGRY